MINWRNSEKELPKELEIVWVLLQHWKKEGGLSCEIYCGQVVYNNDKTQLVAWNNDYIGSGSSYWPIWESDDYEYKSDNSDLAKAWLPVNEFPLPKWLK